MKIKGYISLGAMNDEQTEEIEIPDEELEGKSDVEREIVIYQYLQNVLNPYVEIWYKEL